MYAILIQKGVVGLAKIKIRCISFYDKHDPRNEPLDFDEGKEYVGTLDGTTIEIYNKWNHRVKVEIDSEWFRDHFEIVSEA